MTDHISKNINSYNRDAAKLAPMYNARLVPESIPLFAKEITGRSNKAALRALDIGCGSGRDAAWLADQGLNVVAVDGSQKMLDEAIADKSRPNIFYIHDTAPDLSAIRALNQKFDVILMNAFLFHFDTKERIAFYETLKNLAAPGAYAYITLRHGPTPEGRQMFTVPLDEIEKMAKSAALAFNYLGRGEDPMGRANISWDHITLRFPDKPQS